MTELLIEVLNSDYFNVSCVVIAAVLAAFSVKEYKLSLIILFVEFSLCGLANLIGLKLTAFLNPYGIYIAYAVIQMFAMMAFFVITFKGYKSHWLVAALVGLAAIFNFIMARAYFVDDFYYSPVEMYRIYPNLLGVIMLLQLLYMSLFNKLIINRLGRYANTYTRYLNMVFMVSNWNANRNMA